MITKKSNKGGVAEEALRQYFRSLGFFVVRGAKFKFREYEITDIDLWLYLNKTTITRERINVDIKNRRTPQAIERIFWTKGLQEVLGFEGCIVATNDRRPATRDFGSLHGVMVLDGNFMSRILGAYDKPKDFIEEETLVSILNTPCIVDTRTTWTQMYMESKMDILVNLNFNGFNKLMNRAQTALEAYIVTYAEPTLRFLYTAIAFMLLSLDFKNKELSFLEKEYRKKSLIEGFLYGEAGKQRADEILEAAISLASHVRNRDLFTQTDLRAEIERQLSSYPAEDLAIYFAKPEVMKSLFDLAKQFYALVFFENIPAPKDLDSNLRAIIGLLADHYKLDRNKIL
jgi:hypothetical protein